MVISIFVGGTGAGRAQGAQSQGERLGGAAGGSTATRGRGTTCSERGGNPASVPAEVRGNYRPKTTFPAAGGLGRHRLGCSVCSPPATRTSAALPWVRGWGRAAAALLPPPLPASASPSLCSLIPSGPPCFLGNILSSSRSHDLFITKTLLPCRLVLSRVCCGLRRRARSPAAPGLPVPPWGRRSSENLRGVRPAPHPPLLP